jgi:NADH:ubiquinone oxidoreductase subunit 4 (subunit M)
MRLLLACFFFCLGILYDRYKTRLLFYYGGVVMVMPLFAVFVFIVCLSNFGFPGTFNFVGEFIILVGGFQCSLVVVFIAAIGLLLATIYSLFFYSRVFFGPLAKNFIRYFCDVSRLEMYVISGLVFFLLLFGLFPQIIQEMCLLLVRKSV